MLADTQKAYDRLAGKREELLLRLDSLESERLSFKAGEEIIISFGKKDKKIAVLVPYDKYVSDSPRP
ncbi:MAG: hypothetical protein GY850_05195 [bacterium]|nr:hypothetical protein [bacterium]